MEPPPPPRDHFSSIDRGPGIQILDDHLFQDRFDDRVLYEERRPNPKPRLSALSIHDPDPEEPHSRKDRPTIMDNSKLSPDFLYFRLIKNGDNWSRALKNPISMPVEQIEKKVRKDRGGDAPVGDQLKRMSDYRRAQIEDMVDKANEQELGDASWEVVHIKSKKEFIRGGGMSVPEMEVILARIVKSSKLRTKSTSGKLVDLGDSPIRREKRFDDDKHASLDRKGKRHDSDKTERNDFGHSRVDSGLAILSNPLTNLPLFDQDGRPMGEHGLVEFTGLPAQIPRDKPLGAPLEHDKDGKKDGKGSKGQKGEKSHDRDSAFEDDMVVLPEGDLLDPDAGILDHGVGTSDKHDERGRRGKSPHGPHDHPEVLYGEGKRSRSRHRSRHHGQSRTSSHHQRERSQHDADLVHFPNHRTRQYLDAGSLSSEASDSSHYGYPEYDLESSNTSLGTHGVPHRGSLVHQRARPDVVYKQHRPGPSRPLRRASYSASKPVYYEDVRFTQPVRSYREQPIIYEERPVQVRYERQRPRVIRQTTLPVTIIPEERQIMYAPPRESTREVVPVSRRYSQTSTGLPPLERHSTAPIIVHYPHELDEDLYHRESLDRQSGSIENYQRDRIKEEFMKDREDQVHQRELELDLREAEMRQFRRSQVNDNGASRLRMDPRTGDYYYDHLAR